MVAAILGAVFTVIKPLAALLLILTFASTIAYAQTAVPAPAHTATPTPGPFATATATATATASATPPASPAASPTAPASPALISYTGQLLDYRKNYVYFTTGDAFPAIEEPRILDALTGIPTSITPKAKMFAKATFDPATKKDYRACHHRRAGW